MCGVNTSQYKLNYNQDGQDLIMHAFLINSYSVFKIILAYDTVT
jgi:hypothetical protein